MKEKIGLLYRVSSKPQETDGGSLDIQREIGRRVTKNLGLEPIEFDEGVQSSYNVEVNLRPKLVELLNEIQKQNGIRKVWVFNTDRLGRYSQSWYSILKVFLDYGVQIYIGEDSRKPYDLSNSVDKLVIGVLSLISQYDNELRRLRSVIGKRNSLKNGNTYLGSTIPFGYSVKNKKLVENKTESSYINEIFQMYDSGKSSMDIKMFLDKQIDIGPRRTSLGWNLGTIQKMLRNPLYKGEQEWVWKEKLPNGEEQIVDKITIHPPQLIDSDLWKRVNNRIDSKVRNVNSSNSNNSLLRGFLKCKECGLTLNHRFRATNHYYGRCSEVNWKYGGKLDDSSSCVLKKSLRIEEADEKVMNSIIDVVQNSSIVREQHKQNHLSPKWMNDKKLKKDINRLKKYIREKEREIKEYGNQLVNVEFEIRTKKLKKSMGEKLIEKFGDSIDNLESEVSKLKKELLVISNSKEWINWLDKMNKGIQKLKESSLDIKRKFLNENLSEILVEYDEELKSHKLDIYFKFPIVDDKFEYTDEMERDEKGFKKYSISNGMVNKVVDIPLVNHRSKRNTERREQLNQRVIQLKAEGLSLNDICNKLNREGLMTPTNKEWDKPKLSSYYKNLKEKVPKK